MWPNSLSSYLPVFSLVTADWRIVLIHFVRCRYCIPHCIYKINHPNRRWLCTASRLLAILFTHPLYLESTFDCLLPSAYTVQYITPLMLSKISSEHDARVAEFRLRQQPTSLVYRIYSNLFWDFAHIVYFQTRGCDRPIVFIYFIPTSHRSHRS